MGFQLLTLLQRSQGGGRRIGDERSERLLEQHRAVEEALVVARLPLAGVADEKLAQLPLLAKQALHGTMYHAQTQFEQLPLVDVFLQLQAVFHLQMLAVQPGLQSYALGVQVHVLLGELEDIGKTLGLGEQQAEGA